MPKRFLCDDTSDGYAHVEELGWVGPASHALEGYSFLTTKIVSQADDETIFRLCPETRLWLAAQNLPRPASVEEWMEYLEDDGEEVEGEASHVKVEQFRRECVIEFAVTEVTAAMIDKIVRYIRQTNEERRASSLTLIQAGDDTKMNTIVNQALGLTKGGTEKMIAEACKSIIEKNGCPGDIWEDEGIRQLNKRERQRPQTDLPPPPTETKNLGPRQQEMWKWTMAVRKMMVPESARRDSHKGRIRKAYCQTKVRTAERYAAFAEKIRATKAEFEARMKEKMRLHEVQALELEKWKGKALMEGVAAGATADAPLGPTKKRPRKIVR
jgi:hypothetical protein